MRAGERRRLSAAAATIVTALVIVGTLSALLGGAGSYAFGSSPLSLGGGPTGHAAARALAGPSLTLSLSNGTVGTLVTATGAGFPTTAMANLTWDGTTVLASGMTTAAGGWVQNFTVPLGVRGAHAVALATSRAASASAPFAVNASITLSPSSGGVGTVVALLGTGFASLSTWTVGWSGVPPIVCLGALAHTDSTGTFACSFTVPSITGAIYTVNANDSATPANKAKAAFDLPTASLTFTPARAAVGAMVAVAGAGFVGSTGSTMYAVDLRWAPSGMFLCENTTAADGTFSCSFTVPTDFGGPHTVTATDPVGTKGSATFTVVPSLTLTPAIGPAGTSATAAGTGFSAMAAAKVTWGASAGTLCTATTDASGSFSCSITVPSDTVGAHTVTATAVLVATASFTETGAFPTVSIAYTSSFAVLGYMPLNLSLAWTITASQAVSTGTTGMWLDLWDMGSSACGSPPCLVLSTSLNASLVNGTNSYTAKVTLAEMLASGYNGGVLPFDTGYQAEVFVSMTNQGSTTVSDVSTKTLYLLVHPAEATLIAPAPGPGVPSGNVTVAVSYTGDFVTSASVDIFSTASAGALVYSAGVSVPGSGPRIGVAGAPWQALPGAYNAVMNLSGPWGFATFTTLLHVYMSGGGTVYVNQTTYHNNSLIPGLSNGATGMLLLLIGAIIGLIVALAVGRMIWAEGRPKPAQAWKGQPNECHVCHQGFDSPDALSDHMKKAHGM
jgi:hypothetical protein